MVGRRNELMSAQKNDGDNLFKKGRERERESRITGGRQVLTGKEGRECG